MENNFNEIYDKYKDTINTSCRNQIVFLKNNELKQHSEEMWNILQLSYAQIGGLKTYRDYQDFLRKIKEGKLVFSDKGAILACAIYRRIEGSHKLVAIGCNQEFEGKEALKDIIKDDIRQFDMHYWAEVSDAIEYFFKKYNGYPIPNILASEILGFPSESEFRLEDDNVHYNRKIQGEFHRKMIFGFKSKEIYDKVLTAVDDYSLFMKEVNSQANKLDVSEIVYTVKQAIFIIENIYRLHEEDGFNELIPSWNQALNQSLTTLRNVNNKTETVEDYIEYGEYLTQAMTVLTLNNINVL